METSAKASINVEEAFFTLARDIKAKMEKRLVSWKCITNQVAWIIEIYWNYTALRIAIIKSRLKSYLEANCASLLIEIMPSTLYNNFYHISIFNFHPYSTEITAGNIVVIEQVA